MAEFIAGLTAGLLTLFDLDRTFYVPENTERKLLLYTWQFVFIIFNALLAAGVYNVFKDVDVLAQWPPALRAVLIGASWLALFRSKFATLEVQGRDVPFGLEAIYEAARGFVYKRINRIVREARKAEIEEKIKLSLADLGTEALLNITLDATRSDLQKRVDKEWLNELLRDEATSEEDKKLTLANFILSGQFY